MRITEWIVRVIQVPSRNAGNQVRVCNLFSEVFNLKVGVHQGSVLTPSLFLVVLDSLSQEFRTSCPWKLLYAHDLVLVADTMDALPSNSEIGKYIKRPKIKELTWVRPMS